MLASSGAGSGTGGCAVTMEDAKSVSATFTKKRYTLGAAKSGTGSGTVSDNLGEIDCGSDCSGDYDADTVAPRLLSFLTAPRAEGRASFTDR